MKRKFRLLLLPFAVFMVLEECLWERLGPLVHKIFDLFPFAIWKAQLGKWLELLSPIASLFVVLVPITLFFPVKILGVYFLSQGMWGLALCTIAFAKLVGMGVSAFLFQIAKPKLMLIPAFVFVYRQLIRALNWSHILIEPIKMELKRRFRLLQSRRGIIRSIQLLWRIRKNNRR